MGDLIDRQAAIDAVKKNTFRLTFAEEQNCDGHVAWSAKAVYSDVMEGALLELPSAQPDRKKGRWVKHDTGHSIYYDCSLCGCVAPCTEVSDSFIWKLSTYCPDCGAKMGND